MENTLIGSKSIFVPAELHLNLCVLSTCNAFPTKCGSFSGKLVIAAKEKYFCEQGIKLLDTSLGPKTYWSILNNVLQKMKIPIIPPLWKIVPF